MSAGQSPGASDRVLTYTRVIAAIILPFLGAAVVLLYLLPDDTDATFAWTIQPALTAMFLGCAYAGGIVFFVHVLRTDRWHRVKYGFPAVIVFASLLAVTTFLHWDRFHFGHISFYTWVTLYLTTPVLVLVAAARNWRADPGTLERRDYAIPRPARIAVALVGIVAFAFGLALFVAPAAFLDAWAWQLTPLTGRVVGAILTLPGMVNVWLLVDARWSAFRWIFQAQIASLVFIAGALVFASGDLAWRTPAGPAFVAGIAVSLVAFVGFYGYCERQSLAGESAVGEQLHPHDDQAEQH
ncbi:hypothetical protein GCM10027413_21240 [Conyzicola nivalis]|uniref:Uncharacterized protein n=1 Tax=Conyzicola nivalis TaxID=1477021 RepID=A0A916SDA5_9MICO|nr:hypothetical protein [Conyzicola nivalis]GGA93736.1 hypothetical protein GCM10010979_05380 [Conyzicola nivalis]